MSALTDARERNQGRIPAPPLPRRTLLEYRPFPVDSLPPLLRDSVMGTADAVGCDPVFAALPALVLAGASIGAAIAVRPKRGFVEVPILWGVVIGDSGTAKTPAATPYIEMAHGIEEELKDKFDREMQAYGKAVSADESGAKELPKPVRSYFAVDDITIERLVENLQSSPRGIVLFQDELANWFGSFVRYKGKGSTPDSSKWLSLFEAKSVNYQRRTGTPREVFAKRAAVSVSGGIQPGILRNVLADEAYIASGLAARLIFAMPPKRCPRWTENEGDEAADLAFRDAVRFLRGIPFNPQSGSAKVGLETEARNRFIAFMNENADRAEALDGGPMAAVLPKIVRIALRLALIHHCLIHAAIQSDPAKFSITDDSMFAGVTMALWFSGEAERVYAMIDECPDDKKERSLAELVERKGGRLSPRELQRTNNPKYPTSEVCEAALDVLVTSGWGVWQEEKAERGGHTKRVFVLHSTLDTRPAIDTA